MDFLLLHFFNQTLAHPLLDVLMVGLTVGGFAVLPSLGVMLLMVPGQRRVGVAMLASLAFGFVSVLIFQYLALRPRPEAARLLLPTPNFPSYPSGHAAAAFGVATVMGLTYRQWYWWSLALGGATLMALSRVYLGVHYPTDVFGGAVLGAAIGAACYGLFKLPRPNWQWLLWSQVAIVIVVSHMAYLDILPLSLLRMPLIDKVLHFVLFGAVVFWLNLWLKGRSIHLGRWVVPVAIVLPLTVAVLDEGAQLFTPLRSADLGDLVSDLAGMFFFWWMSTLLLDTDKKITIV